MFVCSCTLASPDTCFNCKNYSSSFLYGTSRELKFINLAKILGGEIQDPKNIEKYYSPNGVVYSSDRYELVEKKDWKLNQLKKKLEEKKQSTDYYSKVIDKEIALLAEYQKEVEDLEKEIKELEQ